MIIDHHDRHEPETGNRVLVLGRMQSVLDDILRTLDEQGISAQGTTDAEHAPERFDARNFDLISIGGGLFGAPSDRLRKEFSRQNPVVQFLDAFGPVAVRQIVAALERTHPDDPYLANVRVVADGPDEILQATIRKPCILAIEIYRTIDAPPPPIDLIARRTVTPGPIEIRIAARYRTHGMMLLVTVDEDDDEFYLHRMSPPAR